MSSQPPTNIHSTAIVDPSAKIGEGVEIGPYSIVGPDVILGDNVWIGPHVVVEGLTSIGAGTQIFQFASIGSKPQDLKFKGEKSTLEIGKGNIIREYVTIQPGTINGLMKTTVGDNNLLMACTHIGHDCVVGSRNVFANQVGLSGHVTVLDNVVAGGMVGVHQFVRIGSFSMIGGGSMVGQDIPPYCVGQGDRCMLRGINTIGLQRAGFGADDIADVKKTYRALFGTLGSIRDRAAELDPELAKKPHISVLLKFLNETQRGICSPSKSLSGRD